MPLVPLLLGLVVGVVMGTLGGGGAILTVPALVYLLDQDPRTATTSSLLIVGTSALISVVPHARAGRVRVAEGVTFGLLGILGALLGSLASARVPDTVLMALFSVLLCVVAAVMIARSRTPGPPEAEGPPACGAETAPVHAGWGLDLDGPGLVRLVAAASAVGLLTGFFGVGGGFMLVPMLVLVLGFPMRTAVGTSLLVIAINSATSLGERIAGGGAHLDWPLVAAFTVATVTGSLIGSRLTGRFSPQVLTRAFAGLLVLVAGYSIVQTLLAA